MKNYPITPKSGINTPDIELGIDVYERVTQDELYTFAKSVDGKMVRVSLSLLQNLVHFNSKNHKSKKSNRFFEPTLSKYTTVAPFKGGSNDDIRDLDRVVYLSDLGAFRLPESMEVKDSVLVISRKTQRVLGFAYIVEASGLIEARCFVRYTTLTEKSDKAQKVIETMVARYGKAFENK